ncbi:MAG TPA: DUF2252 family protein, partial [Candidatus Binatia bacterium]|nr:DUF2252 family protein [Candidatus Binatia bacterium]
LRGGAVRPRRFTCLFAVIAIALAGTAYGAAPIRPNPESLERATPELIKRLRAEPYDYFRFVNRSWIARVCDDFSSDLEGLPVIRLHGDAHVEQFALTRDAWGLDDFDDSARGPAVVDIVRFLGSVDLVARRRSWQQERDRLFDRFVEGYKRGLLEPDHLPPPPDIVGRLRTAAPATRAALLAWGESKMQPLADASMKAVAGGMEAFAQIMLRERPDLEPEYFRVVRAGSIQSGVGSAVTPKILIRVRGPSDDPADDELLESKKIGDLAGLSCLNTPMLNPTLRIIDGSKQLGRLRHNILAAGPELIVPEVMARGERLQDWWIRSLDPSYSQIRLTDLRSVGDLAAISYDAGVQLGAGRLHDRTVLLSTYDRKRLLGATGKLEKRYRQEATKLVDDLLHGWRELGRR